MNAATTDIFSWFRSDPLPGLMSTNAVVVGGTSLLLEFFDFVAERKQSGSLAIAVPFVGEGLVGVSRSWESINHRAIDLRMVVRRDRDADVAMEELSNFPWKSMQIGRLRRLHAKVYTFVAGDGAGAVLIGSHNLSQEGGHQNHEAGVLLLNRDIRSARGAILDVHDEVCALVRKSAIVHDSAESLLIRETERN